MRSDRLRRALGSPAAPVVFALLAVVAAFYLWTASSSGNPIRFEDDATDYYNLLADAYLAGQLSLQVEPAPELLALPNPYDPVANAPYRLHDLSLYEGRYYVPWGPTPALTLFIPFRLLPFGDMPENLAVVLFCLAGLAFSLLLFRLLVRRYLPSAPAWAQVVGVVALAFGNVAPFLLRRPVVYEAAISAGYCFLFAGLYLIASGLLNGRRSIARLALGSLCLGLAVGARPSLAAAALVPLGAWLVLRRSGAGGIRTAVALAVPLAACVVLLAVYNQLRFDSFTELGHTYQLAGVEVRKKETVELSYVPPGLYFYFLAPARLTLDFPFLHLPPPPGYPRALPDGYDGIEVTGGVLTNLPIVLFLVAAVPLALTGRMRPGRGLGAAIVSLSALGVLIALALSIALWGTTMRYEMDFAALLVVAALLAWLGLFVNAGGRRRQLVAVGGTLLIAYGAVAAAAFSITGYYDSLRTGQPETYRTLERFFSPLPTLATMVADHPVLVDLHNPTGYSAPVNYGTAGAGAPTISLTPTAALVEIVAPRSERIGLEAVFRPGPAARPGVRLALEVRSLEDDSITRLPVRGGLDRIPVRVRRGHNEIELRVAETPAPAGRGPADPLVSVEQLHPVALADG